MSRQGIKTLFIYLFIHGKMEQEEREQPSFPKQIFISTLKQEILKEDTIDIPVASNSNVPVPSTSDVPSLSLTQPKSEVSEDVFINEPSLHQQVLIKEEELSSDDEVNSNERLGTNVDKETNLDAMDDEKVNIYQPICEFKGEEEKCQTEATMSNSVFLKEEYTESPSTEVQLPNDSGMEEMSFGNHFLAGCSEPQPPGSTENSGLDQNSELYNGPYGDGYVSYCGRGRYMFVQNDKANSNSLNGLSTMTDEFENSEDSQSSDCSGESSAEEIESDIEDDDTAYNPTWAATTQGLRDIPFTGNTGLLCGIPGENKPIDWFNLVLDIIFLESIVRETNKYAQELFFGPTLQPKSRVNRWKDLTVDVLKKFIGLLLHMGTIQLNRFKDYWSTNHLFDLKIFPQTMSRDRFLLILRCLHYSSHDDGKDKLSRVRPLLDYFNDKMTSLYYPSRELSLDKGMVLWRGRLFRNYITRKCHKYGLKFYALAEPTGFITNFTIHSRKAGKLSGKGHASKVVHYLMKGKLNMGHSIYMDYYYSSFILTSKLLQKNTYCTGILRLDRKHTPAEIKTAKLKSGEKIEKYAEGVMIGKWKDKGSISYISSEFENTIAISRNKRGVAKNQPLPIIQYIANMKGVIRNGQLMSNYPCRHKLLKWYKKVFVHVIQMLLMNSFQLFQMANPDDETPLYDFRLAVIEGLIPKDKGPTPAVIEGLLPDDEGPTPAVIEGLLPDDEGPTPAVIEGLLPDDEKPTPADIEGLLPNDEGPTPAKRARLVPHVISKLTKLDKHSRIQPKRK